jgi:hypothetical protein
MIQIDARWEALSDQLVIWCCIDRLSWHRLSGLGPRLSDGPATVAKALLGQSFRPHEMAIVLIERRAANPSTLKGRPRGPVLAASRLTLRARKCAGLIYCPAMPRLTNTLISTRRFSARPSGVSFVEAG